MKRGELFCECASMRAWRSLAGVEDHASLRKHIQTAPLIGQLQGIAERCAGEAGWSQFDALSTDSQCTQQYQRVEAWLGENRVANPDRIPTCLFSPLCQRQQLFYRRRACNKA